MTNKGRFVVWTYSRGKTGRPRTIARFAKKDAAKSFAKAVSLAKESNVYVDEELSRGRGEPIATYMSGMSFRI